MKKLNITIELENEAFTEFPEIEIQRILNKLSNKLSIEDMSGRYPLYDSNGNKIGYYEIED